MAEVRPKCKYCGSDDIKLIFKKDVYNYTVWKCNNPVCLHIFVIQK